MCGEEVGPAEVFERIPCKVIELVTEVVVLWFNVDDDDVDILYDEKDFCVPRGFQAVVPVEVLEVIPYKVCELITGVVLRSIGGTVLVVEIGFRVVERVEEYEFTASFETNSFKVAETVVAGVVSCTVVNEEGTVDNAFGVPLEGDEDSSAVGGELESVALTDASVFRIVLVGFSRLLDFVMTCAKL
ncbi:hypothetical protein Q1695_003473 [Nippostrongylus brasiliensis]|nr:hypothetical protein Q1695_003473 [Nippostrongylus brasiliensis]